jgi:hypothetical protein
LRFSSRAEAAGSLIGILTSFTHSPIGVLCVARTRTWLWIRGSLIAIGRNSIRGWWLGLGIGVLAIGATVLTILAVYTPTVTVHIHNDSARQVTASVCGSDPQTAAPGRTIDVDPNRNDPHAACVIYEGASDHASGCLYIPTTRYRDGTTVDLSQMVRGVPAAKCGD